MASDQASGNKAQEDFMSLFKPLIEHMEKMPAATRMKCQDKMVKAMGKYIRKEDINAANIAQLVQEAFNRQNRLLESKIKIEGQERKNSDGLKHNSKLEEEVISKENKKHKSNVGNKDGMIVSSPISSKGADKRKRPEEIIQVKSELHHPLAKKNQQPCYGRPSTSSALQKVVSVSSHQSHVASPYQQMYLQQNAYVQQQPQQIPPHYYGMSLGPHFAQFQMPNAKVLQSSSVVAQYYTGPVNPSAGSVPPSAAAPHLPNESMNADVAVKMENAKEDSEIDFNQENNKEE